jgi:hypothetical protein
MSISVVNKLPVPYRRSGNQKKTVNDVTFDSSYLEGGEPLSAKELGLNLSVEYANCFVIHGSESATLRPTNAEYTPSTGLIHLIDSATGKEVESTKDMSKVVVRVEAFGW